LVTGDLAFTTFTPDFATFFLKKQFDLSQNEICMNWYQFLWQEFWSDYW